MQDEVKVSQADVGWATSAAQHLCSPQDRDAAIRLLAQTFARHRHQAEREEEEAYKIGIGEGRQEMVREIDLATGGDGEFRWSTEPDRHCPCEEAMKARVIERFHQAERETLARMEPVAARYRHKKRGTVYEVIGEAELQVANTRYTPGEGDFLVVYRGEDGKLWARWDEEFHDGRFEALPPAPEAGQ